MRLKVLHWIENIITVVLLICIGLSLFVIIKVKSNYEQIPSLMGYRLMTILTGSMRPAIEPGDMVITKSKDINSIMVGDVITYKSNYNVYVTHRVVEIINNNGDIALKVKGDANNIADQSLVKAQQLIGAQIFRIPYGGYVAKFASSKKGIILFIVIPVLLLVGGEIRNIIIELRKRKQPQL